MPPDRSNAAAHGGGFDVAVFGDQHGFDDGGVNAVFFGACVHGYTGALQ